MKIIIVHNHYKQHGGEDVVFDQERELLKRKGHDVQVYCRHNSEIDSYTGVQRLVLLRKAIWADDTYRDFGEVLRREKPDIVHIHNIWVMISPSIYWACHDAGVPVVQTFHNYRLMCPAGTFFREGKTCEECLDHGQWRSVLHGCYRDSRSITAAKALMLAVHRRKGTWTNAIDYFITLSQFSRNQYLRGGFSPEKLFVKPNFVYPDPGVCMDKGDYAVFVGRLSPEKRVSTVLDAWTRLSSPVQLLIIGGGPEAGQLEADAAARGLTDVHFKGHLPREQGLEFMRRARFLIFSSEWYENFPVTIAEAFACGVPVICSRMGAMQEIVEDGRTGLHFTPGNAEDLAAKVNWAWRHPDRLQQMGEEARQEYESKYTDEKNYPLLMNIYQHAISKRDSKSQGVELEVRAPDSSETPALVR
ncbi:MAG TPA: glycosyltransferase [Candidatus Sulfotelmatobacter sp.]|nr:glycosyltransferase [Candidatus Sulfotelmatobacter sp.]